MPMAQLEQKWHNWLCQTPTHGTTPRPANMPAVPDMPTHRHRRHNRPTFFVEYKQKAHAITEISKQLRLGKELQLDAAEFLRRAERGLGVAIRDGQDNGTVRKHHASNAQGRLSPLSSPRPTVSPTQAAPFEQSRPITPDHKTPGQPITHPNTPKTHTNQSRPITPTAKPQVSQSRQHTRQSHAQQSRFPPS